MRRSALALLCAGLLVGCAASDPTSADTPAPSPSPSRSLITTDLGGRAVPGPAGITLVYETGRSEQKLFQRSVRDLARIGIWKKLTDGLHYIELETHPGARSEAGVHLADAVLSHTVSEGKARVLCDIRFYPRAIQQERRLWRRVREVGVTPQEWRDYNTNGVFDESPPTRADFWSSILAHELAHCLVGPHGESAARGWEYKAMRRLSS